MTMNVTAVFDIGKTNKRFYLFDEDFNEVYRKTTRIKEIADDEGFPSEDIDLLALWIFKTYQQAQDLEQFTITHLNFTGYGAALVHLNNENEVVAPVYNYAKSLPKWLRKQFYKTYGSEDGIAINTGSPPAEMLNAGLQWYWLKYGKPKVFEKINQSLFLPQYASFLFTNKLEVDYTSLGYQTMLWDYPMNQYHHWVKAEGVDEKIPPITTTTRYHHIQKEGHWLKVGVGIQNSAAALFPYYYCSPEKFILLSTGTWSIAINPFDTYLLSEEEYKSNGCCYLRYDGGRIKANKLHLGNEFKLQLFELYQYFKKDYGLHRTLKFDDSIYKRLLNQPTPLFHMKSLYSPSGLLATAEETNLSKFMSFKEAYHRLIMELVEYQYRSIEEVIDYTKVKRIYVDGTFAKNEIFMKTLAAKFKNYEVYATVAPFATALGAALAVRLPVVKESFLKNKFKLKKYEGVIT